MDNLAISVRRATADDAPAIAALVNDAFALERAFVDGDRTSVDEIAAMTRRGVFLVLEQDYGLAAAIYLEPRGDHAYFGMLSVAPDLQGMGLGKRLVGIAEALAEASGATRMTMRIINLREELARWYRGLGYRDSGTTAAVEVDAGVVARMKRPFHFVNMHKRLGVGDAAAVGWAS